MTRDPFRKEAALPRFSLQRRITVFVLLATIVVVGLVAARSIEVELIPRGYTEPFLTVWVPWRDAPPPAAGEGYG